MGFGARFFLWYLLGLLAFVAVVLTAEQAGVSARWLGLGFLVATIALYAGIGIAMRTQDVVEYYVAGRRIPGFANGMATAADWMSAASFIGLAGIFYWQGFLGFAYLLGWSGGFVLVAIFLGPYLRRFGQFTVAEFIGARFGSTAELIAVLAVVLASFVYLVAQIYAVGLVASRFVQVPFEIGLVVGLAGILVCSFLGGMRGVTWTQVSQYLVLIVAFVAPLVLLAKAHYGTVVPHLALPELSQRVVAMERQLAADPAEEEVRAYYRARAEHLRALLAQWPESIETERQRLWQHPKEASERPSLAQQRQAQQDLRALRGDAKEVRRYWQQQLAQAEALAQPPRPFFAVWQGSPEQRRQERTNFLALMFVLMVGTAALPHILMRYYTTSTVAQARTSTAWTVFFVSLLYACVPLYALFAKTELERWFGAPVEALNAWLGSWSLLRLGQFDDLNGDGRVQSGELLLNADAIVLVLPELAGLPYVLVGFVAAGALAAALSTADGLLLTISNGLGHDVYFKRLRRGMASTHRQLVVNKMLLLLTAGFAAWTAALRLDTILLLVGLAFSLAAATLFPTMIMGIFWRRATRWGAVVAMLGGFAVSVAYYVLNHPAFGGSEAHRWFGIEPVACGIFGVAFGLAAHLLFGGFGWGQRSEGAGLVQTLRRLE